jgi:hypothetical protein
MKFGEYFRLSFAFSDLFKVFTEKQPPFVPSAPPMPRWQAELYANSKPAEPPERDLRFGAISDQPGWSGSLCGSMPSGG